MFEKTLRSYLSTISRIWYIIRIAKGTLKKYKILGSTSTKFNSVYLGWSTK